MKSPSQRPWILTMLVPALLLTLHPRPTCAQEPEGSADARGQFAGMQRIGGTLTALSGSQVTLKTVDGAVYQVITTENTRVMRGRGNPVKLSDLKVGDGIMALGNLDAPNKAIHAAMVIAVDADQMKRIEEVRKQQLANLGKTMIAGRVTAIDMDNVTMTIERPDGVPQTIGFDEGTSFRRGRMTFSAAGSSAPGTGAAAESVVPTGESITLADIKVGDRVMGPGELKGDRFIAKQLTVMVPGEGRRRTPGSSGAGGPENNHLQPSARPK